LDILCIVVALFSVNVIELAVPPDPTVAVPAVLPVLLWVQVAGCEQLIVIVDPVVR
jgi:hypothetical protein